MHLLKHLSWEGENTRVTHTARGFQCVSTDLEVSRLSATLKYLHGQTFGQTQNRYQQYLKCQLQQRAEHYQSTGFKADSVCLQRNVSVCVCVLSFLSTMLLLADGSANPGTWGVYLCGIVLVSWGHEGRSYLVLAAKSLALRCSLFL